ncbi:MAG: oligosaccharide flippase family protein [Bacteroidia bacterium]|nr:oligosaccharide flippase family protein [Bacteroidia bacterium]
MIRKLAGHSLVRNSLRIFSGNVLIQLVSFLFLPVFSRVYSPSDYGVWGIFVFLSGFIAVFAGLRYELAIMIPESNRMAYVIFKMTQSLAFYTCVLSLLLILFFYRPMLDLFHLPDSMHLWLLVPLQAWLTAMNNTMMQWYGRKNEFRTLAHMRILQSLSNIAVSLFFGYFLEMGYYGLIYGLMISVLISDIYLAVKLRLPLFKIRCYPLKLYRKLIFRYKNFLYFSTPLGILNYFSTNILVSVLQINYGAAAMGLYTNANRLIQSPLSLISSAVSMVFYPHFSKSEKKQRDVILVFSVLVLVFSLILLPLVFFGEELLGFYLGEEWIGSARFIRLLFVFMVLSTAVSCISPIFSYLQKDNLVLVWQVGYLLSAIGVFRYFSGDLDKAVFYYSLMGGLAYFLLFCLGLFLLRKGRKV